MATTDVHLYPSVGKPKNFPKSRSFLSAWSPRSASIASFVAPKPGEKTTKREKDLPKGEKTAWIVNVESIPVELRDFYIATHQAFIFFQQLAHAQPPDNRSFGLLQSTLQNYSRIIGLYYEKLTTPLVPTLLDPRPSLSQTAFVLSGLLYLVRVLYLPPSGSQAGLVGEELLDWVNTIDVRPSTEDGQVFDGRSTPWDFDGFWDYIQRSISRGLTTLADILCSKLGSSHPSASLRALMTNYVIPLLTSHPRSTNFELQSAFETQLVRWQSRLREGRRQFDLTVQAIKGRKEAWVDGLRGVFEIWEGNTGRIFDMARDGGGWREALAVWGIWVRPTMRRDDIPDVAREIVDKVPPDPTLKEQGIEFALALGDIPRALALSGEFNQWLAAHLVDAFQKLDLIEDELAEHVMPLRTHFILSYAEHLMSDPNLWRIAFDYAATCDFDGPIWIAAAISHVPLNIGDGEPEPESAIPVPKVNGTNGAADPGDEMDVDILGWKRQKKLGKTFKQVEELIEVCSDNDLEDELRSICKVVSETLVRQRRYGDAVAYAVRASDVRRVRWIAERILWEYIQHGAPTFIRIVNQIPTSLVQPPDDDDNDQERSVFASQLTFVARYRDFHDLYAEGRRKEAADLLVLLLTSGVAPKKWWAMLLVDAFPLLEDEDVLIDYDDAFDLLRCLDEIYTRSSQGAGEDYLDALTSILKNGAEVNVSERKEREADTLGQLEVVRLALARQLARCCVSGRR